MSSSTWARGALLGPYPGPALGLVPSAGYVRWDDFDSDTLSRWALVQTGAAPLSRPAAIAAAGEHGVWELFCTNNPESNRITNSTTQPVLYLDGTAANWPAGLHHVAKVRRTTASTNHVWHGFASDNTTIPGTAMHFVGVHYQTATNTIVGRTQDGASTTTVTLATAAADNTSFRAFGFEFLRTPAGDRAVQFFRLHLDDPRETVRENIGSPITTTLPAANLYHHALGQSSTTTADRSAFIDFVSVGGRVRR